MAHQRFRAVAQRRPDLRFPFPANFVERVTGARLNVLTRRGKYLAAALDTEETLVMHLGMSGRFTISEAEGPPWGADTNPAHDHVEFEMENGARIIFNDPRRFGFMLLTPSDALETTPPFDRMGPEPLSNAFNADALRKAFAGRQTPVKAALLDQRNVAGLGNIYVCEALFRAGISPKRAAGSIGKERLDRLTRAIKDVLNDAIAAGGSSLRDYAQADGALGYFQHAFEVYDREGAQCARPGCAGQVARLVQSNRSTFYCTRCQR